MKAVTVNEAVSIFQLLAVLPWPECGRLHVTTL